MMLVQATKEAEADGKNHVDMVHMHVKACICTSPLHLRTQRAWNTAETDRVYIHVGIYVSVFQDGHA